jgi:hypothetical protein
MEIPALQGSDQCTEVSIATLPSQISVKCGVIAVKHHYSLFAECQLCT